MRHNALTATALSAALVVLLAGCSVSQILDVAQGKTDVFSIEVGDCFNDDLGALDTLESVEAVVMPQCTEEHDNEAYHLFDLSDSEFPEYSAEGIETAAEDGCFPPFEDFIGAPYEGTALEYGYYLPSAESWAAGDREVLCLVYSLDGPVSEPLRGKGPEYPYEG